MKLATKLVSIFMVLILLVIAADGWMSLREETSRHEREEQRQMIEVATALRLTVRTRAATAREATALVEQMSASSLLPCRWVWFDEIDRDTAPRANITSRTVESAEHGVLFPVEVRREKLRLAYVHVPVAGDRVGGIEMEANAGVVDGLRSQAVIRSLRVAGLLILLSALTGVFFGQRLIATPLRRLTEKTRRIGRGDLSGPVTVRGRDELGELAQALNRMCDDLAESRDRAAREHAGRLDAVEQLRHADRLRTVGQLAAGIAHELGTPLNVVSGRAGLIAAGTLNESEIVESARIIKTQSDRIAATVRQLLDFARPAPPQRRVVDLGPLVDRTLELLDPAARKAGVELRREPTDAPVRAHADPGQLEQIVTNLVVNAIQAMPDGGTATARLRAETTPEPLVCLDVEDTGPGLAPDVADRVFDPFFTTKEVGAGTGMGLAVARGIALEHGGDLTVRARAGRGARFTLRLPGALP